MKLTLLTHQKEFDRPNNTGVLCEALDNVITQRTLWKRTEPDQALIHSLEQGAVLLSPFGHGEQVADINNVDHFVLLDGTWQEARKMYNRSAYLKSASWFTFGQTETSRYNLRRNQVDEGLCTAECVMTLLRLKGYQQALETLTRRFDTLIAPN